MAGPTAVGKTATCIELAQRLNTVVISADSRQFYQEMHIGTAKPSTEELKGIPHHFLGHLSIADEYSVGEFEREVLKKLEELFQQYPIVIMTGGSGLFIQAVCRGLDDMPTLSEGVRAQLMQEFEQSGLPPLLKELEEADPVYYKQVDRANHARVIRALEVIRSVGKPFSSFRNQQPKSRPFNILKIGLDRPREKLYERINMRVDQMIEAGLVDEVRNLKGYRHLNALQTVGYKEIFPYLDGEYALEEAVRLLKRNTRRYSKKQLTWFKRDEEIHWFHPDSFDGIWDFISKNLPLNICWRSL